MAARTRCGRFAERATLWADAAPGLGAETETLFVGPQALKAVGKAARAEIEALFPGLLAGAETPAAARILAPGRQARQLAQRHLRNEKPLVM